MDLNKDSAYENSQSQVSDDRGRAHHCRRVRRAPGGAESAGNQSAARSGQLQFQGPDPDHESQRRQARGGVVLSVRRRRPSARSSPATCSMGSAGTRRSWRSTPTTGKEIWVHDGLNGITSKGINYWESEDGKDRRLIFSVDSFLQEIDARDRQVHPDVRQQRRRGHARRPAARRGHEHPRAARQPGPHLAQHHHLRRPVG